MKDKEVKTKDKEVKTKDKEVKTKDKEVNLLADEVEAIKEAISFAFETGYSDKGIALIESVAALTTIDTVMNLAIKREEGAEK